MDITKMSLEGKVAVITGGSRGLGYATALAMAKAGANVVVASRKVEDLEKVAEEIKAIGVKSLAVACHVAKLEESQRLVDTVVKEFGKIDVLFNNAGTNPYFGPLLGAEEWAWDVTNNVNLKGAFFLAKMVALVMKEKGAGGSIINTASVGGLIPSEIPIYNVTKAALIMLTKCMAREWGQYGIRANAISPGVIKTKLSAVMWETDEAAKLSAQLTAIGRLGEPDDVAKLVLFLASDASSYITGENIAIDGGQLVAAGSPMSKEE